MAIVGYPDLFALGLGIDFAGAVLLSQGLLATPEQAMLRATSSPHTFARFNIRDAENRADGLAGVVALCMGFALQATGYAIQIAGGHAGGPGTAAWVVAVACAVLGCLVTLAIGRALRWPLERRFLIEVARWDHAGRHTLPDGGELFGYGVLLKRQSYEELRKTGESFATYSERVCRTETRADVP